jgi:hypothetical protein
MVYGRLYMKRNCDKVTNSVRMQSDYCRKAVNILRDRRDIARICFVASNNRARSGLVAGRVRTPATFKGTPDRDLTGSFGSV